MVPEFRGSEVPGFGWRSDSCLLAAGRRWRCHSASKWTAFGGPSISCGHKNCGGLSTVRDASGRLTPDLKRDAFEIRDNGEPTPITVFSNDAQPITVALMLDMSGSMSSGFLRVRDGTLRFIDALLPADRVRIGFIRLRNRVESVSHGR